MRKQLLLVSLLCFFFQGWGQAPHSERMLQRAMQLWADSFILAGDKRAKWRYDQGVILKGAEAVWYATGKKEYFDYIQRSMDFYVNDQGTIKGYEVSEFNIDHINNGRALLLLSQVTKKAKYRKATDLLMSQLKTHPRNTAGGFWHKKIYPNQIWLDGLYMGQPFYAEYLLLNGNDSLLNDISLQFALVRQFLRDPATGLYYHGWDESRKESWSNPQTGLSPNFWGRSLGWLGMALVDVLEYSQQFTGTEAGRKLHDELSLMLREFAAAIVKFQDKKTGLWWDIVDQPKLSGNYPEASASCMLTYTLAKGMRLGILDQGLKRQRDRAYKGILSRFVFTGKDGLASLRGTVSVSGLGGKPYRDGSTAYYLSEPVIDNDPKGIGAFILCAAEMEKTPTLSLGKNKTVVLDYYYNNEWEKNPAGKMQRWHYTWEDKSNSGYYVLGHIFRSHGARTERLEYSAASLDSIRADIYIIVDPDTEKETASPNYISGDEALKIRDWVGRGGTLVLLGNDAGNAEFKHLNGLSSLFGIRFIEDSKNRVINDQFEQGLVQTPPGSEIFGSGKKLFIKEFSSLELSGSARAVLTNGSDIVMALAEYGKGRVIAMGDPWIYNEYVDGRKLPAEYQNYPATEAWVNWLLKRKKNK